MAEAMETEMDFSDGEQANPNGHVSVPQYSTPPAYNRTGLSALHGYGNSATIGLGNGIERRLDHEQLPGYIFICNGRTKADCYRYRVFGIPKAGRNVVESIKPGMKLFLYDFEKRLLYGVYEATIGGKLDIEPEAFERKYPAQVGFRIVKNCYPLPENTFKSALYENYKGGKFKQELAPHQVMHLLSLFRPFTAPELDALPHRFASRASAPRALSFEERFIAATQLRNASSVLDPLSARHAEPRLGSLMPHQSVPRTPLLQHTYSRQDEYATPVREALSLSSLNQQPYFPTDIRQQRSLGDSSRSIQDPQLKYLTILSNIRRYGTDPEFSGSENEYHPATPSEKDKFASPYSDNSYYPSTLSRNEQPSASAANGNVYRSELSTSAAQKEGEASQQHEIPAGTYYHPEVSSTVPNTTMSMQSDMQAASVAQSQTEIAGYPTQAHGEAPQPAAGAVGYSHQPQSVAVSDTAHPQPVSVEESKQPHPGTASYSEQQYYAAMGYSTQLYAGATGYTQQPPENGYGQQHHAAATGYPQQLSEFGYGQQHYAAATAYPQQPYAAAAVYPQQPNAATTAYPQQPNGEATAYLQQPNGAATLYPQQPNGAATAYLQQPNGAATLYPQQPNGAATAYLQQPNGAATAYLQQPNGAATAYPQQPSAGATAYPQQPNAGATAYAQQPYAQGVGYATQPHAQAVGYTPQYHAQAGVYTQQAVMQGSIPAPPGTTDWNAATGDWNAQRTLLTLVIWATCVYW
ncbi:unnamed protein product [Microthlaspi erraticum]|uniref:DCD domain-containing protein n=1 Tax=Microthlaspi erraticum TaxID=1685480 RepID=A0A6D2J0Z2_9BRAS|nr:unnamed protein product [Microthlaspi erraticum]